MVTLRILGGATLDSEAGPIAARALQRRRIALLALLATSRKPLTREKVTAYLWPESDSEQARHLLSVAVYELRKAIHEDAIVSTRDEISLNPIYVDSDVAQFENAIAERDLAKAIELYRGPFLDGFHINDAAEFERWVDGERDRLARAYARALEELAQQHSAAGDAAAAVAVLRKLAAHDPYSGRTAVMLMLALEAAGARAEALQHARTHAALLREEFGADADPEVEQLAERLRREPREIATTTQAITPVQSATAKPAPIEVRIPKRSIILPAALTAFATVAAIVVYVWVVSKGGPGVGGPDDAQGRSIPAAQLDSPTVTVAVRPFRNLSTPADTTFFAEGLSEEMINALSSVSSLRVLQRASTFPDRDVDLRGLGVTHILEGAVRRGKDRLRITAGLIDAKTQVKVWSKSYDKPSAMIDAISIQEDIARSVVAELRATLTEPQKRGQLVSRKTDDVDAFNLWSEGMHYLHRRTVVDMQRALTFFNRAIERDSTYATAYAHKAEVLALLGAFDYGALPPARAFPAAITAAERALELDENLADAHAAMGTILFNHRRDFRGAEEKFKKAVDLNPGYAMAYHWYSLLLHALGRREEALEQVTRARAWDPVSPVTASSMARYYYFARDFPQSVEEFQRAQQLDSGFVTAHVGLGVTHVAAGNYSAALHSFDEAARRLKINPPLLDALRTYTYGRSGNRAEALKHRKMLNAASKVMFVPAEIIAVADIGVGDYDAAFAALNRAVDERSGGVNYLRIDPLVDPIRNDPRFSALLKRVFPPKP
jgi:DNA-binding SARP family transcriptional activator/TolB-like protein/Tfp pilus assembly protein PilF